MLCETDIIMKNIPHIQFKFENIMQNIVIPYNNLMDLNNVILV